MLLAEVTTGEVLGGGAAVLAIISGVMGILNKIVDNKHSREMEKLKTDKAGQDNQIKTLTESHTKCEDLHEETKQELTTTRKELKECHDRHEQVDKRIEEIENQLKKKVNR